MDDYSSYDGLGLLWSQTSPDTGTTTFTYDGYGRLTNKHLSGGTNQNFTRTSRMTR